MAGKSANLEKGSPEWLRKQLERADRLMGEVVLWTTGKPELSKEFQKRLQQAAYKVTMTRAELLDLMMEQGMAAKAGR